MIMPIRTTLIVNIQGQLLIYCTNRCFGRVEFKKLHLTIIEHFVMTVNTAAVAIVLQ